MTSDRGLGPLGWRLLAAFLVVALSSVVVLTSAALIGTSRGITQNENAVRERAAVSMQKVLGNAYTASGDWSSVNMDRAIAIAEAVDAQFMLRDPSGTPIYNSATGTGMGLGMGMGRGTTFVTRITKQIVVNGAVVGIAQLGFTSVASAAQDVAWTWIGLAAVVALASAFAVALFVTRRISTPLLRISNAARTFAAGDRSARTDPADASARWELGELARAFDATADNVVRSEVARRRLSADVAHELRTPLAALQAGLEELRDGYVAPDIDRLAALHAQSIKLGRVVEDLAALAAAESASLSLRRAPVELRDVVVDAFRGALPILEAAGVHASLARTDEVSVDADSDRLHQAVSNLLSNAARYCRPGDAVSLSLSCEADSASILVADTGPGLPDDELGHVFERLWRGTQAADISGSGIGLAVVRELVEAHGGTVSVERNAAGGLTFAIRLPR